MGSKVDEKTLCTESADKTLKDHTHISIGGSNTFNPDAELANTDAESPNNQGAQGR